MWKKTTRFILINRVAILIGIAIITVFAAYQAKNIKYTYSEVNLLPSDDPTAINYNKFKELFGEDATIIIMGTSDPKIYTPELYKKWDKLGKDISNIKPEDIAKFSKKPLHINLEGDEKLISNLVSVTSLKILKKDTANNKFVLVNLSDSLPNTSEEVDLVIDKLHDLPFYDQLLYNKKTKLITTSIVVNQKVLNTQARVNLVMAIDAKIKEFEKENAIRIHVSGMPYVRTFNAETIIKEISNFVYLAMFITAFIFFLFFRSFSATLISIAVITIAVIWSFGTIGFFGYKITVLTGLIPPLIIVIGFPNVIFLLNKFHQEYSIHGNKIKSISRIISKIGNATLLTNTTTALGFATFISTNSSVMREFGIVASINIFGVFLLSIFLVPIIYSFRSAPKKKHLKHLNIKWTMSIINWISSIVKKNRPQVYAISVLLLCLSIIGIFQMKISGSIIDDMPKGAEFYKDIKYFESQYEGVMPLEVVIDTKRKGGVYKSSTLKRIDEFCDFLNEESGLSKPLSVVNLIKYAKQTFYNDNPKYYQLPSSQERSFILDYAKNSILGEDKQLGHFVDSTGRYARITLMMEDVGTDQMDMLEGDIQEQIDKIFPKERYEVIMTGGALVFLEGTHYLVKNLFISLSLAIFLIAFIMAWMFRSPKMILISLIPNLLPLIITAGIMGFLGIPIKPSTILVFSIAFGISVDDTIHFLAKYRQELGNCNWKIASSVFKSLEETGKSMFYTSIVLFFGFLTFALSSFGGTQALGGLISITLFIAMSTNLILLPSLLLSLEKRITNKKDFKKPIVPLDTIDKEDDNFDEFENIK